MKKALLFIAASLSIFAVSCQKEISSPDNEQTLDYKKVPLSFTVGLEDTKALMDGTQITWEAGDQIAIYDGVGKNIFTAQSSGVSTTFTGEAAMADSYIAISPYSCVTNIDAETTISTKLNGGGTPQRVSATHNVDPTALIASTKFSKDATGFTLKNQYSLVKITITRDDIQQVTILSNNSEEIYGTNYISKEDGETLTRHAADAQRVNLKFTDGENDTVFAPGTYYIVIWPTEFTKGFKVKMQTAGENPSVGFKSTAKAATFNRNSGLNIGIIDKDVAFAPMTIMNAEELKAWAANAEYWTNDDYFKLGADIDLEGYNWPTVDSFAGTLDGQGHSITNFVVDNAKTRTGFIGTLAENGSLINTTFGSSTDASSITLCQSDDENWCYAGICGYVNKNATVSGVTTYVPVTVSSANTTKHSAGGICGNMKANTTISDCINWSTVTDNSSYSSTSADSCIGGIAGMSDSSGKILNCKNNGKNSGQITNNCTGTPNVGGIVGRVSGSSTLENCENNAYVINAAGTTYSNDSFKVFVGGVAGAVTGSNVKIIKCKCTERAQSSAVLTSRLGLGGIVGGATGAGLQIQGCTTDTGTIRPEFINNKDVAVGGIIGYSNNTILISKAEDGTLTKKKSGFQQTKAFNGTAYVGGIAGLLDKDSTENIVEYCETASGARFEFNDKGNSGKTVNCGGICGATKGIIRNCTNNLHFYARKGDLSIKYGGICGGASSTRPPKEITYCTNNGNIGCYPLSNDPVMGGILCTLFPGKTVMKYCTNKGAITTGQATTSGTIQSIQSNEKVDMGALCGDIQKPASGSAPITILEGCVIDCKFIAKSESNYKYIGLVCGWLSGTKTETGLPKVIIGSSAEPIRIVNTTKIELGTDATPTVETVWYDINSMENAKKFVVGPYLWNEMPGGTAGKGNFTSVDGEDFLERFELNLDI